MEEFFKDDPGFGLNIVCADPTPKLKRDQLDSQNDIHLVKKKKYNKYEKRRYKAKMAKMAKEGTFPHHQQPVHRENHSLVDVGEEKPQKIENNQMKGDDEERDSIEKSSLNVGVMNDEVTTKEENKTSEKENASQQEESFKNENDSNDERKTESFSMNDDADNETIVDPNRKPSRRYHLKNELDEEEKRAAYMAEFHAHPLEMDRRNKADSKIKLSTPSSHIFMSDRNPLMDTTKPLNDEINNGQMNATKSNKTVKDSIDSNAAMDGNDTDKCPFQHLGLHKRLSSTITSERGPFAIKRPTVIQARAMSLLLPSITKTKLKEVNKNQNVFIQSETGSGKTLAYLLPIIQSLLPHDAFTNTIPATNKSASTPAASNKTFAQEQRSNQTPQTLIILPTRELALQTYQTAIQLTVHSKINITPVCLSGGEKRKSEKARLRKGFSILIGTPGRILDHLQKTECLRSSLSLGNDHVNADARDVSKKNQCTRTNTLKWLVLDEADRLLDMGLGGQVKQIMEVVNLLCKQSWIRRGYGIRSVLVSATITEDMKKLAKDLLDNDTNDKKEEKQEKPPKDLKDSKSWIWVSAESKESSLSTDAQSSSITKVDAGMEETSNLLPLADAAPRQLAQQHMIVSAKLRLPALVAFLMARVQQKQRVVVFMATCDGVDYHHKLFSSMDNFFLDGTNEQEENTQSGIFGNVCNFFRLHGNIPHAERNLTVQKFTNSKFGFTRANDMKQMGTNSESNILFTTDVAARGLNLPSVDWIVQYDPPCEIADYVHRAGRTARAGKAGNALLFLLPSERQYIEILDIKGLKGVNTALSLASTLQHAAELCPHLTKEGERKSGGGSRIGEAFAIAAQIKLEEHIVQDTMTRKQVIKKLKNEQKSKGKRREGKQAMAAIKEQQQNNIENGLQALARNAFTSFLRAYPTKEKAVRHIFSTRALHLGHVARSFALKDPPKALRTFSKKNGNGEGKKNGLGFGKSSTTEPFTKNEKKRNADLAFELDGNKKGQKPIKRSKMKNLKNIVDRNDTDGVNHASTENIKTKMMSAARRIQSGGMEFF